MTPGRHVTRLALLAVLALLAGVALWVGIALMSPTRPRPADIPPTRVLATTTPIVVTALPVSAAEGTPVSPSSTAPVENILTTPTSTPPAPTATVAPTIVPTATPNWGTRVPVQRG